MEQELPDRFSWNLVLESLKRKLSCHFNFNLNWICFRMLLDEYLNTFLDHWRKNIYNKSYRGKINRYFIPNAFSL
jgi:hypothetical protein